MPCKLRYRLLKFIIHLIHRFSLRVFCSRSHPAFFHCSLTYPAPVIRIIGNGFGNDILRSCDCVCRALYALFFRDILLRRIFQRLFCILQHDKGCQRLQPFLLRDRCPGSPLRAIRTIQIFHSHLSLSCHDLLSQLLCHFTLFFNAGNDLSLLLLEISQIYQTLVQLSQLLVI